MLDVSASLSLLALSLIFRIFRALHDGLSDRGKFFDNDANYGIVGWWPWHLVNWAGRDFFIALLYVFLFLNNCPLVPLALAVVLNYYLHRAMYGWAVAHRSLFK